MAKIQVEQPHNKPEQEVREMVEALTHRLEREYQLSSQWQGNTVRFKRSGLSGKLIMDEGLVAIHLELGMMMSAFTKKIRNELTTILKEKLA